MITLRIDRIEWSENEFSPLKGSLPLGGASVKLAPGASRRFKLTDASLTVSWSFPSLDLVLRSPQGISELRAWEAAIRSQIDQLQQLASVPAEQLQTAEGTAMRSAMDADPAAELMRLRLEMLDPMRADTVAQRSQRPQPQVGGWALVLSGDLYCQAGQVLKEGKFTNGSDAFEVEIAGSSVAREQRGQVKAIQFAWYLTAPKQTFALTSLKVWVMKTHCIAEPEALRKAREALPARVAAVADTLATAVAESAPLRQQAATLCCTAYVSDPMNEKVVAAVAEARLRCGDYGGAIALFSRFNANDENEQRIALARFGAAWRPRAAASASGDAADLRPVQRRGFLMDLAEIVGPPPSGHALTQFKAARTMQFEATGMTPDSLTMTMNNVQLVKHFHGLQQRQINRMIHFQGWEKEEATTVWLLLNFAQPGLGLAVREGRSTLAAALHAVHNAISRASRLMQITAPDLFMPARGWRVPHRPTGLFDVESQAETIERPDASGSFGANISSPLILEDLPWALTERGIAYHNAQTNTMHIAEADVVRFVSRPNEPQLCHTAALLYGGELGDLYALPPNTLVSLEGIEAPPWTATFRRWHVYQQWDGMPGAVDAVTGLPTGNSPSKLAKMIVDRRDTFIHPETKKETPTIYCRFTQLGVVTQTQIVSKGHPRFREFVRSISWDRDPDETFTRTVHGRRCLTLSITYICPPSAVADNVGLDKAAANAAGAVDVASKFGADVVTLTYLDRRAYTRGTEELTDGLNHSMQQEWQRPSTRWTSHSREEHTGSLELEYVLGAAGSSGLARLGLTGERDQNNQGTTLDAFRERANNHIRERFALLDEDARTRNAAIGVFEPRLLSTEEIVAVRLYTGPAFQPINGWLREIACLPNEPPAWMQPRWGAWTPERAAMTPEAARRAAALDSASSFGATVGALISAIRKLAAANTKEENDRRLYRGLRGALEGSFWLPDALGIVCAVDAAFMSTSLGKETPIHYMAAAPTPNILWELKAASEDSVGFHCGAEVAMLSQYEGEREVLFPPLTLLRLERREGTQPDLHLRSSGTPAVEQIAQSIASHQVHTEQVGADGVPVPRSQALSCTKHFQRLVVHPLFA